MTVCAAEFLQLQQQKLADSQRFRMIWDHSLLGLGENKAHEQVDFCIWARLSFARGLVSVFAVHSLEPSVENRKNVPFHGESPSSFPTFL